MGGGVWDSLLWLVQPLSLIAQVMVWHVPGGGRE